MTVSVPRELLVDTLEALLKARPDIEWGDAGRIAIFKAALEHLPDGWAKSAGKWAHIPDVHIVEFAVPSWSIEHPLSCHIAAQLHDCPYHKAINRIASTAGLDTDDFGRWRIVDIDDEGLPSLERIP